MSSNFCSIPCITWPLMLLVAIEAAVFLSVQTGISAAATVSLGLSDKFAADIAFSYGIFVALTPVVSGFLADNFLGRFVLVVVHLVILAIGTGMLLLSTWISGVLAVTVGVLGIFSVGIGHGINRVIVPTFNADQIAARNTAFGEKMFSMYYAFVNVGGAMVAFISMIKDSVRCDDKPCFRLMFGLLLTLVVVAFVVFLGMKKLFRKPKVKANILVESWKCIVCAIGNKGGEGVKVVEAGVSEGTNRTDKTNRTASEGSKHSEQQRGKAGKEGDNEETDRKSTMEKTQNDGSAMGRTSAKDTPSQNPTTSKAEGKADQSINKNLSKKSTAVTGSTNGTDLAASAQEDAEPTNTFLDKAYPKFSRKFIKDLSQVLQVCRLFFIGIPFWMAYNSYFGPVIGQFFRSNTQLGKLTLTETIYLTCNPIMCVTFIFCLNKLVYPMFKKCGFPISHITKIVIGGSLCVAAFGCSLGIEMVMMNDAPYKDMNFTEAYGFVYSQGYPDECPITLQPLNGKNGSIDMFDDLVPSMGNFSGPVGDFKLISDPCPQMVFNVDGTNSNVVHIKNSLNVLAFYQSKDASQSGSNETSSSNGTDHWDVQTKSTGVTRTKGGSADILVFGCKGNEFESKERFENGTAKMAWSHFQDLERTVTYKNCPKGSGSCEAAKFSLSGKSGGKYAYFDEFNCRENNSTKKAAKEIELLSPSGVGVLWMFIPLIIITFAEVFLAVGAIEFAYAQTSPPMRSIVQAFWQVTNAVGCLCGLVVNQCNLTWIVTCMIYMGSTALFTVVFFIVAKRYKYVEIVDSEKSQEK